jgi:hypothetical protein
MNVVPPGFHYPRLAEATNQFITFPITALSPCFLEQLRHCYKKKLNL